MAKKTPTTQPTEAKELIQGGHKRGKFREFEKLSKSQGKLREI